MANSSTINSLTVQQQELCRRLDVAWHPYLRRRSSLGVLLASSALGLGLSGCQAGAQLFPFSRNAGAFLGFYLLMGMTGCLGIASLGTAKGDNDWLKGVAVVGGIWLCGSIRIVHELSLNRETPWLSIALVCLAWMVLFLLLRIVAAPGISRRGGRGGGGRAGG